MTRLIVPPSPSDALEQAFLHLLYNDGAFYSHMMLKMDKIFTRYVPVAGVTIKDTRPRLLINPVTFPLFSLKGRAAILEHEIIHLIMLHIIRRETRHKKVWNLAADCAVNSIVKNIPGKEEVTAVFKQVYKDIFDFFQIPEEKRETKFIFPENYNLPRGQVAEWYYEQLIEDPQIQQMMQQPQLIVVGGGGQKGDQQNQQGSQGNSNADGDEQENQDGGGSNKLEDQDGQGQEGSGSNPFDADGNFYDAHFGWDESDQMTKDMSESIIREMVAEALRKSRGEHPAELEDYIDQLLTSKVNWRQALRQFIARSKRAFRFYTWKRPSRRYPDAKGTRKDRQLSLVIAVDTSGSISNMELALFFGEIRRIVEQTKCIATVVECDAAIQNVWEYERGRIPRTGHGRGGTDFRPVFEWIDNQKKRFDCVIYLTDSYGPAPSKQPLPTLWAITPDAWDNRDRFCGWGTKVKLDWNHELNAA